MAFFHLSSQKVGEGHLDVFKLQGIISIFGADKARDEIDETTEHAERKGSKLLSTLSKIGAAAIAAGAAAVVAVGKQALLAYADYEQLVGGVDTLSRKVRLKYRNMPLTHSKPLDYPQMSTWKP